MPASKADISGWFDSGVSIGATHMIVVVDTYEYEDYPYFVSANENVYAEEKRISNIDMQRVMEIYNLSSDKQSQLAQFRAFNY